ncbi:hypothetical protein HD806DRAFT_523776 [Xylariaceae sp. AK1471]|nr:hypothetical protein HD806DRAFT_523776 [Xylariaceae sp. AK1471]
MSTEATARVALPNVSAKELQDHFSSKMITYVLKEGIIHDSFQTSSNETIVIHCEPGYRPQRVKEPEEFVTIDWGHEESQKTLETLAINLEKAWVAKKALVEFALHRWFLYSGIPPHPDNPKEMFGSCCPACLELYSTNWTYEKLPSFTNAVLDDKGRLPTLESEGWFHNRCPRDRPMADGRSQNDMLTEQAIEDGKKSSKTK